MNMNEINNANDTQCHNIYKTYKKNIMVTINHDIHIIIDSINFQYFILSFNSIT